MTTATKIKTDFVPAQWLHLITPGKVYEVYDPEDWSRGGYITADNGSKLCVYFLSDAFLDGKPWTVLKESEE